MKWTIKPIGIPVMLLNLCAIELSVYGKTTENKWLGAVIVLSVYYYFLDNCPCKPRWKNHRLKEKKNEHKKQSIE